MVAAVREARAPLGSSRAMWLHLLGALGGCQCDQDGGAWSGRRCPARRLSAALSLVSAFNGQYHHPGSHGVRPAPAREGG